MVSNIPLKVGGRGKEAFAELVVIEGIVCGDKSFSRTQRWGKNGLDRMEGQTGGKVWTLQVLHSCVAPDDGGLSAGKFRMH